jgi:hypothetical protein
MPWPEFFGAMLSSASDIPRAPTTERAAAGAVQLSRGALRPGECGGAASGCEDLQWQAEPYNAVYLRAGAYRVLLRAQGYIDRYLPVAVQSTALVLSASMVPLVPPSALRVVLLWAERPADLDLWVLAQAGAPAVYWQTPDLDPALDGQPPAPLCQLTSARVQLEAAASLNIAASARSRR